MNKVVRFIIHSKAAAYIAALLCVIAWVLHLIEEGGDAHNYFALPIWAFATYLSVKVGRELSFNEARSPLPVTLFFMGCSLAPQVGLGYDAALHFLLFSMACYTLLRTYRNRNAMASYFLSFALIGVQCLMEPSLLLVLPWVVLCGVFMDSLRGRTLFASLWGLLMPFWMVSGVLFLTDKTELIAPYIGQVMPSTWTIQGEGLLEVQLVWVLLLTVSGGVVLLFNRTMRAQASAGYRLLMLALVVLLIAVAISPDLYSALSPCILLYASLIGATMFVGSEGRVRNFYLVALLAIWLALLGLRVWSTYMRY